MESSGHQGSGLKRQSYGPNNGYTWDETPGSIKRVPGSEPLGCVKREAVAFPCLRFVAKFNRPLFWSALVCDLQEPRVSVTNVLVNLTQVILAAGVARY